MSIFEAEFIKKFKTKNTIILLAFFVIVIIGSMFFKPTLETENSYFDKNYKEIIDTRNPSIIANEKFQNKINHLKELQKSNLGKISENAKKQLDNIKVDEYKDITFWKVFEGKIKNPLIMLFFLIFIIAIFSTIYTNEVITGVDNLILSSKNKFKVLNSKLLMGIIIPTITYGIYLISQFISILLKYGSPQNGNLQAFRILDFTTLDGSISIQNFILLKIGTTLLLIITFSLIAILCSFLSKTSLKAISLIGFSFVIFKFIPFMKFLPQKLLYIFDSFNFPDLFLPEILQKPPMIFQNSFYVNFFGFSISTFKMILTLLVITLIITFISIKLSFKKLTSK